MDQDRTNPGGDATTEEPALTQKNSATVIGEETLADDTRTKSGAVAPSYGAGGGTTDATEEGGDGT